MKNRYLLPVFALSLFLSAFLLFAVQPVMGKLLLSLLGGSPSVWNTAMVFFQGFLLAGYAYAHLIAKILPLRLQGIVHALLMALFLLWLPIALPEDAKAPALDGQTFWQLGIMLTAVGGPFFILASSAPLLQHWFASSPHEDAQDPYFLYAVSNAGSMSALILYPILIEPFLGLKIQSWSWAGGYILLFLMMGACAYMVRNGIKPSLPLYTNGGRAELNWKTRAAWVVLSLVPSSLMLGVTTLIATDIASAPFLWVIPLALYLLSFIFAFGSNGSSVLFISRSLAGYAICFSVMAFMVSGYSMMVVPLLFVHLAAFFICALYCHAELARLKPGLSNLTEYYLLISVGGVLGGAFNALAAPVLFPVPLEYPIMLSVIGFVLWAIKAQAPTIAESFNKIDDPARPYKLLGVDCAIILIGIAGLTFLFITDNKTFHAVGILGVFLALILLVGNRPVFAMLAMCALLMFEPTVASMRHSFLTIERNYFGILKVSKEGNAHLFSHGTTLHGSQWRVEKEELFPTTYYSKGSPAGDVFSALPDNGEPQRVAVLGLGVGSVACYPSKGRTFDFYEIDRDVADIASNPRYFSYLSNCGSPYDVIIGDARQMIKNAPDGTYNLIFADAFSSDNIPVHILTREAIDLYKRKLAPGGFIAFNISNRYLNLRPVIDALAQDAGLTSYFKFYVPDKKQNDASSLYTPSSFAVMASSPEDVAGLIENHEWHPYDGTKKTQVWTDDYANILSSLSF